jgi:hypothetical protein
MYSKRVRQMHLNTSKPHCTMAIVYRIFSPPTSSRAEPVMKY